MKKDEKKTSFICRFLRRRVLVPSWMIVTIVIAFFVIYYATTSFFVNKLIELKG